MPKRKKRITFPASSFFNKVKARGVQRKRTVKRILFFLAFAFLVYRFFAGPFGFVQIHSLWKEKKGLERESAALQADLIDLEIEKTRLTDDDFYLEKQARERLGMVKEGEKVYRIIHEDELKPAEEKEPAETPPPDSLSP